MSFQDVAKPCRRREALHKKHKENVPHEINAVPQTRFVKGHYYFAMDETTSDTCPPRVSPATSGSSSSTSRKSPRYRFSELNNEIVQFQGMVRQLEALVKRSGDTPEDQWRSRILLRSAEGTDHDLGKKMKSQERAFRKVYDPSVRASYQKLSRDYKRIHDSFQTLLTEYKKQQHEVITQLGGEQGWLSPEEAQKQRAAQLEEDFFDRAMRERENEVKQINDSMHQVNTIYKELGRIVHDQQEQIDQIKDHVQDSKEYTEAGLEQILKVPYCGAMDMEQTRDPPPPPQLISEEDFHWSLPFKTMGEDMKEVVQKDILGLGIDIISMTRPRIVGAGKRMMECTSDKAIPDEYSQST